MNNVKKKMLRNSLIIIIVFIACNNPSGNDDLSQNKSDTIKPEKATLNPIDSLFESVPTFIPYEIYGDSICREYRIFHAEPIEKEIFDKLIQVDSINEMIGEGTEAKIIGKGKININYRTLYAIRSWGEWLCTIEMIVFNNDWELTGYEIIAGFGGDDGESDLGHCKYINDSTIETTWTRKDYFYEPSAIEDTIDSTVIETQKAELQILSTGKILKKKIKKTRRKL